MVEAAAVTTRLEVVCGRRGLWEPRTVCILREGIWALKDPWDDSSSSAGCWGRCELGCFQEAFLLIPGMQVTCAWWLSFMVPTTYAFSNSLCSALLVLLDNWGSKMGRKKAGSWFLTPESPHLFHLGALGRGNEFPSYCHTLCIWLPL